VKEKVLGKEHPSTLVSMSNLAGVLSDQGKYAEAEKMHRSTLALREKVLGTNHPHTLSSRKWIAAVQSNQGRHAEAEELHREMLTLNEKISKGAP